MKKDKQKGITLIALIITVILMLILVSTTAYLGIDAYKHSKMVKFVAMMQAVQSKIDLLVENGITSTEWESLGQATTAEQGANFNRAKTNQEIATEYLETNNSSYRYFSVADIKDDLELDNITEDIVVNIDTREIVGMKGVEYKNKTYYTQYKLPGGQAVKQSLVPTRTLSQIELTTTINGLNAVVKITNIDKTNCKLVYKLDTDTTWKTITNNTKAGNFYEVTISVSGKYTFKLEENNPSADGTLQSNTEDLTLKLANEPKSEGDIIFDASQHSYDYSKPSDNWAFAIKNNTNEEYYVWVPRFKYNSGREIKFMRGDSNIASDNTFIDKRNRNWILPEVFRLAGKTGVWVKVLPHENLDLIDLVVPPASP